MILKPTPAELNQLSNENCKRIYRETLERLTPTIGLIVKDMYAAASKGEYCLTVNFDEAPFNDQDFILDYFRELGFDVKHRCDRKYNIKW